MSDIFNLDIFEKILRLSIGVAQADNAVMFDLLGKIFPLNLRRYSSGSEHNGWVVPHNWKIHKAQIRRNGQVLFDGTEHPLAVAGYSCSFQGTLSKSQLDKRVYSRADLPSAYPFHCMFNYRPWIRDWAFCVPHERYSSWGEGSYEIDLVTEYLPGEMIVGECHKQGSSKETIVFNAHTCHPAQFNDDLSGVAVILQLFKWLSKKKTRYSYLGILAPEHLGTVFYLASLSPEEISSLNLGCFVEMVGIPEGFAFQETFTGRTILDAIAFSALRDLDPAVKRGTFRTIVGNDETVWEAPGIEIPFASISRCVHKHYYSQYHTSHDNLGLNSTMHLSQALDGLKRVVDIFEQDVIVHRNFTGLVALSNPRYNLYVERPEPTVQKNLSPSDLKLGALQDRLPRYFDGTSSVFEISQAHDISFFTLLDYVRKFQDKGLVRLEPIPKLRWYERKDRHLQNWLS